MTSIMHHPSHHVDARSGSAVIDGFTDPAQQVRAHRERSPELQAAIERITSFDPSDLVDSDLLADLLDKAAEQPDYVTHYELARAMGLGETGNQFEHPLWALVERYTRLIADVHLVLGYRAALARVADGPLFARDHQAAINTVLERDRLTNEVVREHCARYIAQHGPTTLQRARAQGIEPTWCLQGDGSRDTDGLGTWHDGQQIAVVIQDGPSGKAGAEVQLRLSAWQPEDEARQDELVEVQWPENAGHARTTLLSLPEAERLGNLLLLEVERAYASQHDEAAAAAGL